MPHLNRSLQEHVLYPEHPPRKPTALYTRNHHKLVVELDRPCLACGVRNSTLGDPTRNIWGSKALETHHHTIEDSLINAVDLNKFNTRVLPGLLRHHQNTEKYGHNFTQAEMEEWAHGDEDALFVICDIHHRHPLVGIHAITYPIWNLQDLLIDNYDLTGFVAHTPEEAKQLNALPTTTGVAISPIKE